VRRLAVIDVGTNSVRLLVADRPDHASGAPARRDFDVAGIRPVLQRLAITRLGEGMDGDGLIRDPAAERTAAAVREFELAAEGAGAPPPVIVATHALRVARNPEIFTERVGRPVRLLSGTEEARLGFRGAIAGFPDGAGDAEAVVVDIGGGSVELTQGGPGGIQASHSVPLGCVVLTQRFLAHDPPDDHEVAALRALAGRTLGPLLDPARDAVDVVIGVGGTITTMAALAQGLSPYDPNRVQGYRLTLPLVASTLEVLRSRPLGARRTLPGLQPERADVIIAGALVLETVLAGLGGRPIVVSEADLLWGVLMEA